MNANEDDVKPSLGGNAKSESGLRRGQYSLRSLFVLTTLVAVVCGLVKWHGSDVLVVIAWNAIIDQATGLVSHVSSELHERRE
jgi:hypothetical protein